MLVYTFLRMVALFAGYTPEARTNAVRRVLRHRNAKRAASRWNN